jgi:hypothetical protein
MFSWSRFIETRVVKDKPIQCLQLQGPERNSAQKR